MLPSERYTNYSNTEKQTEKQMGQYNPETTEYKPDDVHNGWQASGIGRGVCDSNTKRCESYYRKLKALYAKWNTYNS